MKFQVILAVATFAAFAACKTPYKATDTTGATADSTATTTTSASTTDSIAKMNTTPAVTDQSRQTQQRSDSSRPVQSMDTAMKQQPMDSSKSMDPGKTIPMSTDSTASRMDSTATRSNPADTSRSSVSSPVATPSATTADTSMHATADSAKKSTGTGSASAASTESAEAPAAISTAFKKQYPEASNVVWSSYDSLAAVPIDLRMAGWKKMSAEDHLATFDYQNEKYYAWYDSDGKWVGSAYKMSDFSNLPAPVNNAIKNAIKTRYAGYEVTNVNREFTKVKKSYEVELQKDNSKVRMLVNADGKITQVFKYVSKK